MSGSSVISLRSLTDRSLVDGDGREVNRPSSAPRKQRKPASPYGSAKSLPKKAVKKTGREAWVDAVKNGGGISSASQLTNTWRNGKPSNKSKAGSSSNFLMDQLLGASGSLLQNKNIRSASGTARVGGTGPVYKDAESYYEEIQILRRQLKGFKNQNSELKAKNLRMDEEISAKSRIIEELLNPESQSNDMVRTLTSKNPAATEVVMSLRRKIYKLEETLRDKETEVRKMGRSIKQTNIEEAVLENQMFLYEIRRLTQLIKEASSYSGQNAVTEDSIADALNDNKGRKAQILIKRLRDDNHHLVLENKSLKNDLMKLTKMSQTEVNLSKDYEDMNRKELLQKISSLEQHLKLEEKKFGRDDTDQSVDAEAKDGAIELKGPLPQQIKQLRAREGELLAEVEKLEGTVKKLKEDRTHYRKMTDDYRQQLENIKKPSDDAGSDTTSVKSEKSPKIRGKSSIDRKVSFDEYAKVKKDSQIDPDCKIQELTEQNAARKIQRGWRSRQKNNQVNGDGDGDDSDNAIISIQSAWRANQSRKAHIESVRDSKYSSIHNTPTGEDLIDDDILMIQSAFRGHSTRKQLLRKADRSSRISEGSSITNKIDNNKLLDIHESESDDDDDVVIGSSSSFSKFRPSLENDALNNPKRIVDSGTFRTSAIAHDKEERLGKHNNRESFAVKRAIKGSSIGRKDSFTSFQKEKDKYVDKIFPIEEEESDDNEDVVIGSSSSLSSFRPTIRNGAFDKNQRLLDKGSYSAILNSPNKRRSTDDWRKQNNRESSLGNEISEESNFEKQRSSDAAFSCSLKNNKKKDEKSSLRSLKSSSSPWSESNHGEIEDTEDEDDVVTLPKYRKPSKKESTSKKKDADQIDIAHKWANSGSKNVNNQDHFSQKRPLLQKSHQFNQISDAEDDDDTLVIAPSLRKKYNSLNNRKSLIEDELF